MQQTLLLSNIYEPLAAISWRKAITMLTLGKVEVVEEYERNIRSTAIVIRLPAVVRLVNRFRRYPKRVKFSKRNIFARDRWTCQYCGKRKPSSELTQDHVIPRSRGGRACWENVVTCCIPCNTRKANQTPQEAGMQLRARPRLPSWVPIFSIQLDDNAPQLWRAYFFFTG